MFLNMCDCDVFALYANFLMRYVKYCSIYNIAGFSEHSLSLKNAAMIEIT